MRIVTVLRGKWRVRVLDATPEGKHHNLHEHCQRGIERGRGFVAQITDAPVPLPGQRVHGPCSTGRTCAKVWATKVWRGAPKAPRSPVPPSPPGAAMSIRVDVWRGVRGNPGFRAVCGACVLKAPELALLVLLETVLGIDPARRFAGEAPAPVVLFGGNPLIVTLAVNELPGWRSRRV